ncbi:BREX-1 system adenine-specific DNA-methyltransferase PglX [Janibacter indicus]
METSLLKSFATAARTELIREVGARITAVLAQGSPERIEQPRAVAALEQAIAGTGGGEKGKGHVADKVAYTWFNRIIALRFMDANGYTGIGVVSPATDQVGQPEVLAAAKRGQLDTNVVKGTRASTVTALLNGTRQPRPGVDAQAEAYALLLADYCRFWNSAMPFMFEREGDYTELLIPANLLADDSVLSRSVTVLTEDVCQDVEVIGWLYQFYISERKDEVFAGFKKNKKAGADEIPAATQLFTPHWIVRYLVENSLGRLWMLNRPSSGLLSKMEYYIASVDEEADFLKISKPEELKVMDPACGSGHMLTYAFDLLYAIYEEEGYAPSEIPGLILANNLYGTEIDPRAGALAAFALTMKAAARRKLFLKNPVEPNICVLDPITFSADELSYLVTSDGDRHAEEAFWNQFAEADTLGSLIQPDPALTSRLARHLETLDDGGDLYKADAIEWAGTAIRQAEILSARYSVVVANPPYMGGSNMSPQLASFARAEYPNSWSDLFAMFIERCLSLAVRDGRVAMITMQSWMYLTSFEKLRSRMLTSSSIDALAHLGSGAFSTIGGSVVSTCAFVLHAGRVTRVPGLYVDLTWASGENGKKAAFAAAIGGGSGRVFHVPSVEFQVVPGAPIAYDLDERRVFSRPNIGSRFLSAGRLKTHDNARYVRYFWEVEASGGRWRLLHNGGSRAAFYGNDEEVADWSDSARSNYGEHGGLPKQEAMGLPGITWTLVGSAAGSFRHRDEHELFSSGSPTIVASDGDESWAYLAAMNSMPAARLLQAINPTMNTVVGNVLSIPTLDRSTRDALVPLSKSAYRAAVDRRRGRETSPVFAVNSLVASAAQGGTLRAVAQSERAHLVGLAVASDKRLAEIDSLVAADWGVLGATREASQISSFVDLSYSLCLDLVSYAVGCMFGRYSLDEPGLILADQRATLEDYLAKVPTPTFTPDADNVIPIVDGDWFEDDVVGLFRQFLRTAFGNEYFEENLKFVTESLGVKDLRDYFITRAGKSKFYDDHVQRYKKRPIYWLFSSPKGSFNGLIYMHRYTPSTVSTVLTYLREYVTKLESVLQQAERAGNAKEADRLRKILVELNEYEHDTLYPKASENVVIDLDDGVKVNYPKFGAALKKITGLEASGA